MNTANRSFALVMATAAAPYGMVLLGGCGLGAYVVGRVAEDGFDTRQRRVDIVHPHVAGGCHVTRDTGDAISRAGFEITSIRRFRFAPNRLSTAAAPKILGTAHAPRS